LVVKAQTLAGGRGKGVFDTGFKGGVHICTSAEEVGKVAQQMLGHRLITAQTGAEGKPVNTLYICERR
jgi:succinyl-CoA synthetase beta subunit